MTLGKRLAQQRSCLTGIPQKRAKLDSDEIFNDSQILLNNKLEAVLGRQDAMPGSAGNKARSYGESASNQSANLAGRKASKKAEGTVTEKSDQEDDQLLEDDGDDDSEKRRERR